MCVLTPEEVDAVQAIKERLLPGELEAVLTHKFFLSEKAGREVGLDYSIMDWKRNHAMKWREARMRQDVAVQFCEMMKHKWIESQKAGHDLGRDALVDWICKYAKEWRQSREKRP